MEIYRCPMLETGESKMGIWSDIKKAAKGSKRNFVAGGTLNGPSHENGGIPIEAEGGEFIIKRDSVNASTLDILEYINEHGDIPMSNAKDRRK